MMCFTGFGQTTSDLTENSKADIIQVDESVSVVTPEIDWDNFREVVRKASAEAARETNQKLGLQNRFSALFQEADKAFDAIYQSELNELMDVGWRNSRVQLITPNPVNDPGGGMSIFYN